MSKALFRLSCILAFAITLAAMACGEPGTRAIRGPKPLPPALMAAALESGASFDKEAPFVVRPFTPVIGDEWIGHAVSYGPYRAGQAPGMRGPSDTEVLEDLRIIARYWSLIRVYGADDDSERIVRIIARQELPIRVLLGVWLAPEEDNPEQRKANTQQVLRGIQLANRYRGVVISVSVGNETQVYWSGHRMQPENLIRYIRAMRKAVPVPVTTADDYNFWNKQESEAVASEVDFIVSHMHPLWNGQKLGSAIGWLDRKYHDVQTLHPEKRVIIGETGWATQYDASKTGPGQQGTLVKGDVSVSAQAEFLIQLHRWIEDRHITTFLFEAFDEPWKGGGENSAPNDIEKHWGVFYENRTPKESFVEYQKHIDRTAD